MKRLSRVLTLGMLVVCCAFASAFGATEGPNLIGNPSVETSDATGGPQGWAKGRYGTNTVSFIYPASPAFDGSRAVAVQITSYTSGDAKWYFTEVPVTAGHTYRFSDFYNSNVPSFVTVQFHMTDGTFTYKDLATPAASGAYTNAGATFVAPANVQALTIFHLIKQVGTLTVDLAELHDENASPAPPPPPTSGNLFDNPSLEIQSSTNPNLPQSWNTGRWGTNTAIFTYPVAGIDGARAAKVQLTSYTSGDAKWWPAEVTVTPGASYTFSDAFIADTTSFVTVQFHMTDGTFTYMDLGSLLPANPAQGFTSTFIVPANAQAATVFHLIKSMGSLTVDKYSLVLAQAAPPPDPSQFAQGMVSLNFDDGLRDSFQNAFPIVNASGLKSTQYIITGRFTFPDYDDQNIVLQMQAAGHEIGAHTRTHPDLTTLTAAQVQDEVAGSKQDLAAIGVNATTFAYPFGAYNSSVVSAVQAAGFIGARTTDDGTVLRTDNHFTLKRMSMVDTTSLASVEAAIDNAVANRQWLILLFHHVNTTDTGTPYVVTPSFVQSVVNYLVQKQVKVVTNAQGLQLMAP